MRAYFERQDDELKTFFKSVKGDEVAYNRSLYVIFVGEITKDGVQADCPDCGSKKFKETFCNTVRCEACRSKFTWNFINSADSIDFKVEDHVVTLTCGKYGFKRSHMFLKDGEPVAYEDVPHNLRVDMERMSLNVYNGMCRS